MSRLAALLAILGLALLGSAYGRGPAVCRVSMSDQSADFKSIGQALIKCGEGAFNDVVLVLQDGVYREGVIKVPDHLHSVKILSLAHNLDFDGEPRIVGAFAVKNSEEMSFEISHVILDGANVHPRIFYSSEEGVYPSRFKSLYMYANTIKGYTMFPQTADFNDAPIFMGNYVMSPPEVQAEYTLKSMMPFPWSMQRAAAYAQEASEDKDKKHDN